MLRPLAVDVFPEEGYVLRIVFDNGETKRFDAKPNIEGEWYGKLADKQYFRAVRTDGFTVVWPQGQDPCPDELYDIGVSVNQPHMAYSSSPSLS